MLIIDRKLGESITLDNDINLIILNIKKGKVRIGIEAPKIKKILRTELLIKSRIN